MHQDRVLLSYEEKVALAELTAAMPAEDWWLAWQLRDLDDDARPFSLPDDPDRAAAAGQDLARPAKAHDPAPDAAARTGETARHRRVGPVPLALIGVLALVSGGLLAAFTSGLPAWCGMLTWIAGTVVTLWAVATAEAVPARRCGGCPRALP